MIGYRINNFGVLAGSNNFRSGTNQRAEYREVWEDWCEWVGINVRGWSGGNSAFLSEAKGEDCREQKEFLGIVQIIHQYPSQELESNRDHSRCH